MSLQVGRLGLTTSMRSPSAVSQASGGEVSVSGFITGTTLADVEALVQQTLGLGTTPERWVPVVATHNPRLDGVYEVVDVAIHDVLGASPPNGNWYEAALNLRRFPQGFAAPWTQSLLRGALRTNAHSVTTGGTTPWHAVPSTAQGYHAAGVAVGSPVSRVGDGGTAAVYLPGSQVFYNAEPTYRVPLADWYKMAATVKVGATAPEAHPVVGSQTIHSPDGWRIENGLLRVQSLGGFGTLVLTCHDGAVWSAGAGVNLGAWTGGTPFSSGSFTPVGPILSARAIRTGPAYAEVVLTAILSGSLALIGIGLRRGATIATIRIESALSARWGARPAVTYAATTSTAGVVHQTSNNADGDRSVLMAVDGLTGHDTTGTMVANADVTEFNMGVGFNIGGSGAVSANNIAGLKEQFFAGQGETVETVAL